MGFELNKDIKFNFLNTIILPNFSELLMNNIIYIVVFR